MKSNEDKIKVCKKIKYQGFEHPDPKILLGIIVRENSKLIIFKTAKKQYAIPKTRVISITDTDEIFDEGAGD